MAHLYTDDGDSFRLLDENSVYPVYPVAFVYNFTCITLGVNRVCGICKLLLAKQLHLFL